MTTLSPLAQRLRTLLDKLALDQAAADRNAAEVADILRVSGETGPDRGGVALTAIALDHYYTALESSLELVRRTFDPSSALGSEWHRALLDQMATTSQGRPAVLDSQAVQHLKDLLAFRHFMRHAYAVDLEWKRLHSLAAELATGHAHVKKKLLEFRRFVDTCFVEAERAP